MCDYYNLREKTNLKNELVLFIFCNPTYNFDGNRNGTPLSTYKSIAWFLPLSTFICVFRNKLCKKVSKYLYIIVNQTKHIIS
jgi:hypothetical protein